MADDVVQMFDAESSTFTYLLIDPVSREAALIDPVDHQAERGLAAIAKARVRLAYILETHAHADHITSAGKLRGLTGAKAAAPLGCGIAPADLQLIDGDRITFGREYDYHGNTVSTIVREKRGNPRLAGKTREEFMRIMQGLDLPRPRLMDLAVPANRQLGLTHEA